ncbi:MAG: ABC transporter ATP-binding protein [Desulfobacteraceae bacterium]|nr:MAG: ABC transporter ATP-binding protein [Desulfobacteraceae bacterium]
MLEVSHVDMHRGETQVLWDICLEVHEGERVAILGSNGAGKSSLLAAVTGAIPPSRGEIRLGGRALSGMRPHAITGLGIALVPEGRRVYKEMTVAENLEMGAFPKNARPHLKETLQRVIELFPILGQRRDQPAGTLSGGEQQMLAIGRALMSRPRLLLVDELSLGLAPMITKTIYRTLSGLGEEVTILLVEQNVEQALNFSRRAYILESGRMTRTGDAADLMADAGIRRAYLGM